jgi:hypothetical protein
MPNSFFYLLMLFLMNTMVFPAYSIVLWQVENPLLPTAVPSYRGQPSPFPQPKTEAQSATQLDDAAQEALLKQRALAKARRLMAPTVALQINNAQLQVKGVTNGAQGVRVLVGNTWVGLNETVRVNYAVNPETAAALQELYKVDESSANKLQQKLNEQRLKLEQEGIQITAVDIKNRQLSLKTPQGSQKIRFNLEP